MKKRARLYAWISSSVDKVFTSLNRFQGASDLRTSTLVYPISKSLHPKDRLSCTLVCHYSHNHLVMSRKEKIIFSFLIKSQARSNPSPSWKRLTLSKISFAPANNYHVGSTSNDWEPTPNQNQDTKPPVRVHRMSACRRNNRTWYFEGLLPNHDTIVG
jgi:hypothetical protein